MSHYQTEASAGHSDTTNKQLWVILTPNGTRNIMQKLSLSTCRSCVLHRWLEHKCWNTCNYCSHVTCELMLIALFPLKTASHVNRCKWVFCPEACPPFLPSISVRRQCSVSDLHKNATDASWTADLSGFAVVSLIRSCYGHQICLTLTWAADEQTDLRWDTVVSKPLNAASHC